MDTFWTAGKGWVIAGASLLAALILMYFLAGLMFRLLGRLAKTPMETSVVRHSRKPTQVTLALLLLLSAIPLLHLPKGVIGPFIHGVLLALIGAIGWLAVELTALLEEFVASRFRTDVKENLLARQVRTRMRVLRRITTIVIVIVTVAIMLVTFPSIRTLGASILASAGLVGIAVGIAARPTLSNMIAGIQIAMTEPIRLDDVVIVENEWGWIEEITSTYVVVRIWDLRRLVLPLTYFIQQPFQNWTRVTADLLGSVYIYADYMVPVEELRQEVRRILGTTDMWDGKVWNLQVTNATDRTIEMRALMSAPDSGTAWNLRCYVREKLIEFLQKKYPQYLPRVRAEVEPPGRAGTDEANIVQSASGDPGHGDRR